MLKLFVIPTDRTSRLNKFLILTILLIISILLVVPCAYAVEGNEVDKDGRTTVSSGGKRTKEEIKSIIQEMRARREAGLDEDSLERWLTRDRTEKYAVQKKFAYSVHSLKKSLKEISRRMEQDADAHSGTTELLKLRDIIKDADDALKTEFAEVEQKCIDERLPDVILDRHRNMAEDHNKNVRMLFDNFDELERLAGEKVWDEVRKITEQIKDQLDEYQAIKDPPLLNSDLPLGFRYIEAPRVEREETTIPSMEPNVPEDDVEKALRPAGDTGAKELLKEDEGTISPMFVSGPPAPEDLDPTIDVQITQNIIDLAASLDNSHLKIYEYVRNNLDFEPYLGSRKGSQETLNQMSGNDYDLSSLLIALLRAANIPARYVRGIVELPVDRAMNWLGVEDGTTAGSILTTVGMEGVSIIDGEGNVVSIRFRHVWVEAYIPYTNYRGIAVDDTGKMWVPMDPGFKGYAYQPGVDILSEMGFDAEAFIDDYISTFHEPSPVELYMQQIDDYLAVNHPELSYENIVRVRTITQENLDFLPGSLPFTVRSVDSDFAEIPSDKRYKLWFHLYNGVTTFIDYTANLPEIAGKRITISYIAATQADQDVIDSYGDLYDTPPYLVNLKPVLKIDGNDVAVGTSGIGMGLTHTSDMHFTTPVGETNEMPVVSNSIIAGTYQAIGVDSGIIDPEIFMPRSDEETPTTDDLTGGKLWKTAMGYLDRIETYDDEVAKTMQMVVTKDVSEAIVENTILVTFSFGTPQTFEWKGLIVDADRCIVGPFPVDGDDSKRKPFMVLSGADGSISENRIFEDMYDEEAVSTIKILELASDMGIPIFKFDSSNIGSIYDSLNLSLSVEDAIYNAVLNGHEVTVPRDNITYSEWYGTGYIDMDPETGAAGYIISGGHSGGATVDVWIAWKVFWFTIFRDLCDTDPITADITFPPADSYFPSLDLWDFLFNNQLHFDVTYTICYEGGGTKTVYEIFRPHYPYPPGNYTFYAGCGTGATRDYTMFGVEIETPDGDKAIADCDTISLNTMFTPSAPPSVSYDWEKSWSIWCPLGGGDGTFTPDNAASTEFQGTDGGYLAAKLEASNTYGTTKAKKCLKVIGVKKIKAEDSDDGSNSVEDADKGVEADIHTIYVARKDTGTVNISVETDPSVAEGDLPGDWKTERVSGTLSFDGAPGKLSAKTKKDSPGDMVVKVSPCSGSSDHFQVKVVVVKVQFKEDAAQTCGFDDYTDSNLPSKSVEKGKSDTAKAEITPNTMFDDVYFKSTVVSKVTVNPDHAASAIQTVTFTGVAKGESEIQANLGSLDGCTAAKMKAKTYEVQTKSVAIRLVHEENDDVQEIDLNKGKPNISCISTGGNGICNTAKSGDDVQLISLNQGEPNQTAITAGVNGSLDTTPGGDDTIAGNTITTGPDGKCNTTAAGDDVHVIAVGNGKPNAIAIDTGADGVCNTDKSGDDTQIIAKGKGFPNQICVSPGTNTKRDTDEVGDDIVTGENINTGPDGICNTLANTTNVNSTDANDADVIDYLNNKVYNQAVFKWTVTRLPAKTVNFDLNRDGEIDVESWMSAEMQVVRDNCKDDSYDHNIFLVDNPTDNSFGFMMFNQRYGFVHCDESPDPPTTISHELGHGGFGLTHASGLGIPENIMTQGAQNKWRLFKGQWDTINP